MKDAYTKLMVQQHTSADADAVFFEKLESTGKQHKSVWKTAIAAACILLMIPVTAWAAETIFGVTKVTRFNNITYRDEPGVGLKIQYEDIQSYSISDFPEYLQTLSEKTLLTFDSWTEAKQYLGISLLSNSILTDKNTYRVNDNYWSDAPAGEHCHGYCLVKDGQLYYGTVRATYERNNVTFSVSAEVTAKHPSYTEERLNEYHSIHIEYAEKWDSLVTTSNIVTSNGIPATILAIGIGETTEYIALFAVNDISYQVRSVGMRGGWNDDVVYAAIMEVLDGFTVD